MTLTTKNNMKGRKWNMMYNRLAEFEKEHGHTSPHKVLQAQKLLKNKKDADTKQELRQYRILARWVRRQRLAYMQKKLAAERAEKLQELGFTWCLVRVMPWEDYYKALVEHVKESKKGTVTSRIVITDDGKVWIPRDLEVNGVLLGRWAQRQRRAYTKKLERLTSEQIEKLDKIGFLWNRPKGKGRRRQNHKAEAKKGNLKEFDANDLSLSMDTLYIDEDDDEEEEEDDDDEEEWMMPKVKISADIVGTFDGDAGSSAAVTEKADNTKNDLVSELERLRQENAKLREENIHLRGASASSTKQTS